jgi:regulator of sigma E protease
MTLLALSAGWTQFFQFFIALSILIVLHEWGHYFAARRTGTRVEKFYLFFDFLFPFGEVLPFSLWKKKIGDTIYGIGWFPLGGYVKIAGMMDESADKEALALPPKPDEFRSKTAPQRLFIMLGGIIVNVLLAIIVYYFIYAIYGEEKLPMKNLKYGIAADSLGRAAGFQSGDIPIAINGKEQKYWDDFTKNFILNNAKTVTVLRDGASKEINIPAGIINGITRKLPFVDVRAPFIYDSIDKEGKIISGTLIKGDRIIAFNGVPAMFFNDFIDVRDQYKKVSQLVAKDSPKMQVELTALRGADTVRATVQLDSNYRAHIIPGGDLDKTFEQEKISYNVGTALPRALNRTWQSTTDYAKNLRALFTSKEVKVNESLGGFRSFMKLFPEQFSMRGFLSLLAFISILLAFMNLLPIPGLDGGYVFFLLIEMITGRKVNDKVMEVANTIGLVLLLGLMLYANGLDVFRAWMGK